MSDSREVTGLARYIGSGIGKVHEGELVSNFMECADLYQLDPPLRGYSTVVVSTLRSAPRIGVRGQVERGIETFVWGVTGDDYQLDPMRDELPGSGWGNTVADTFAEAGYTVEDRVWPESHWKFAVVSGETRLGYREWVQASRVAWEDRA